SQVYIAPAEVIFATVVSQGDGLLAPVVLFEPAETQALVLCRGQHVRDLSPVRDSLLETRPYDQADALVRADGRCCAASVSVAHASSPLHPTGAIGHAPSGQSWPVLPPQVEQPFRSPTPGGLRRRATVFSPRSHGPLRYHANSRPSTMRESEWPSTSLARCASSTSRPLAASYM